MAGCLSTTIFQLTSTIAMTERIFRQHCSKPTKAAILCNDLAVICGGSLDVTKSGDASKRQATEKVRNMFMIALLDVPISVLYYYQIMANIDVGHFWTILMTLSGSLHHSVLQWSTADVRDLLSFYMIGFVAGQVRQWASAINAQLSPSDPDIKVVEHATTKGVKPRVLYVHLREVDAIKPLPELKKRPENLRQRKNSIASLMSSLDCDCVISWKY